MRSCAHSPGRMAAVPKRAEPPFRCRVFDAGTSTGGLRLAAMLDRHREPDRRAEDVARAIVEDVRRRGDRALVELTRRLDGVALTPARLRVGAREIAAARRAVPAAWIASLTRAHAQIAAYHARQVQTTALYDARPGVVLGQRVRPLDAVGIYVPGGRASYPSTVLMTAV